MDIRLWLESLGLGQYEQAFRDSAIDTELLPELTDTHLKEMGIPLGHRLRLLKAIAALTAPHPDLVDTPEPTPGARQPREAERRQLTVMFADLVGSTVLAARLDPEEMREIIRSYQNAVTGEIVRLGGYVARLIGDGVLAYFGWPQAYEDAAERAVRAGLAVTAVVAALRTPTGEALNARVGIATGPVVVGDLVGDGAAQEWAVIGETPNLAARLQQLAKPGSVVVADRTRRLLGSLFALEDLGLRELQGFVGGVHVWRILGEGEAESRFDALHAEGLIPLVGREQELSLLLDRWQLAKAGEGQVVILSGEPGIGKSRIVIALRERLRAEPRTSMRYFCSPQHMGTALWPVIRQLERAARFTRDDSAEIRLDKLEMLLQHAAMVTDDVVPLLAELLSLPMTPRYIPLALTPQEKKARTLRALVDYLENLAKQQPVLLVLEDAHWLDPTTRELFDLIVDRVQQLRVLLVVTCRPEFQAEWTRFPHVTLLSLNRLARAQTERLVAEITGGRTLPMVVLEDILAKTDGVPLFVEELTKAVIESGLVYTEDEVLARKNMLAPLAIPTTLQDSLMARLDRFATAREVAQVGAVLGREFDYELLAAVAGLDGARLAASLDQLAAAELLFRRGTPPTARYFFKHALVQEAAYQSLLKSRRQILHARAAEALRTRWADRVAAAPELLAHHLTEAGLIEDAARSWLDAGEHAMRRSAYAEAISHVRRGLAVAGLMPTSPGRAAIETKLHNALALALVMAQGPGAESQAHYREARALSDVAGQEQEWFRSSFGLWFCHMLRVEHAASQQLVSEMLERASNTTDPTMVLQAHHAAWTTLWQGGALREAHEHATVGHRLYVAERDHAWTALFGGHDVEACARTALATSATLMGLPDTGATHAAEGEAFTRELNHPFSHALMLFHRGLVFQLQGQVAAARQIAGQVRAICTEQGIPVYRLHGELLEAWCIGMDDEPRLAIAKMRRALSALDVLQGRARRSYFLGLLADLCQRSGDLEQAGAALEEALGFAEATGERFYLAELHRLGGILHVARGACGVTDAETCFHHALAIAREQEARLLELRTATSLARLWGEQGERRKAHDLLAPIYGRFTEGFNTLDLIEARQLIETLA